jgi:predicted CXXCH cytochrome family protein
MSLALAISALWALQQMPPTVQAADAGVLRTRLESTAHDFFGATHTAESDLCQSCHVPSQAASGRSLPPRWAPSETARSSALGQVQDPSGPPLALRWAGSTLRCLSCHDDTVSALGVTYRPASESLAQDAIAGEARRRSGLGGPALLAPQWWTTEVMANHPVSVPWPLKGIGYRDFVARAMPVDPTSWVEDPRALGLKLLPDTLGADALGGTAGVECVSCHEAHASKHRSFLRLPLERSQLCLACHQK